MPSFKGKLNNNKYKISVSDCIRCYFSGKHFTSCLTIKPGISWGNDLYIIIYRKSNFIRLAFWSLNHHLVTIDSMSDEMGFFFLTEGSVLQSESWRQWHNSCLHLQFYTDLWKCPHGLWWRNYFPCLTVPEQITIMKITITVLWQF